MIPYFMLEYTTGKFEGKAFYTCVEQRDLPETGPWNSYQQLTTNAEYCILKLWKFNLG
jgi:hypothetical protein